MPLLFLIVFALGARAQQNLPPPPHVHDAANVIDGKIHPEMIKDRVAFRLFFLAAATSVDANPDERKRQRAMLSPARLTDEELAIASTILTDFKKQYDLVVQNYNDAVKSARTPEQLPNGKKLAAELDALVLAAKTKLESSVSGDGSRRLYAHVQSEKSNMRVTVDE